MSVLTRETRCLNGVLNQTFGTPPTQRQAEDEMRAGGEEQKGGEGHMDFEEIAIRR
jgi:hypothetical protein